MVEGWGWGGGWGLRDGGGRCGWRGVVVSGYRCERPGTQPQSGYHIEHSLVAVKGVEMDARRSARQHIAHQFGGEGHTVFGLPRGIRFTLKRTGKFTGRPNPGQSRKPSQPGGTGHGHHTGQDGNPDSCFPSLRHKTVVVVGAPEQLCDREGCTSRLLDKQGFDILLHGAGFCVARRESRDRQSIKLSPVRCANQVHKLCSTGKVAKRKPVRVLRGWVSTQRKKAADARIKKLLHELGRLRA